MVHTFHARSQYIQIFKTVSTFMLFLTLSIQLLNGADAVVTTGTDPDPAELPVLREHETFKRQYTVTNPFERAIRVERVDTSCKCIEQKLHKEFLIPGESTLLDIQIENDFYSGPRRHKVWLYVTDPELEAIEIVGKWIVKANIIVDLIKEDPSQRPADKRYRDIYRYTSNVKPDEGKRLKKYIRMNTPDDIEGGLQITPTYTGNIWAFSTKTLDPHTVLLIATARDPKAVMKEGLFQEDLIITSNHPHKKTFTLEFVTSVDKNAGNKEQKKVDFRLPYPMPQR